jgi:acetyltransferase-like isoleucine patch superfamily enzyme
MNSISVHIRRGQGPLCGALKTSARTILTWHVPVVALTKPWFGLLYHLHVLGREVLAWVLRFLWFEPLFRSQCLAIGPGFQMERLPYITGRGRITIGQRVRLSGKSSFGFSNRSDPEPAILIGSGTFIGHGCALAVADSITIGENCLLSGGVSIRDFDGHPADARQRREHCPTPEDGIRPVVIGDDVWIGAGAMILKGVSLGDRAIIGAGAVVTRDVPADSVVAGNPARVVRAMEARS